MLTCRFYRHGTNDPLATITLHELPRVGEFVWLPKPAEPKPRKVSMVIHDLVDFDAHAFRILVEDH